jgi:YD repeat-containing protein
MPFGPLSCLTYGNNNEMTKIFDQAYRLTSIHTGSIQQLSYAMDAASSITSITDNLDPLHSQGFSYDSLYRLISAEGIYGAIDYTMPIRLAQVIWISPDSDAPVRFRTSPCRSAPPPGRRSSVRCRKSPSARTGG